MYKIGNMKRSELLEYLDKVFIPYTSKVNNGILMIPNYKVFLIVNDYSEYVQIMNILKDKGIKVYERKNSIKDTYEYEEPISQEVENRMLEDYKNTKNKKLLYRLVINNLHRAAYTAYKYGLCRESDMEDDYLAAQEGLLKSILEYDLNSSYTFSQVSLRAMINEIRKNSYTLSSLSSSLYGKMQLIKKNVENEYGEKLYDLGSSYEDMANEIIEQLVEKEIVTDKNDFYSPNVTSFDALDGINIDNAINIKSIDEAAYSKTDSDLVFDEVYGKKTKQMIDFALSKLTDRERRIIELRYGLNNTGMKTYDEIGKVIGISRIRAMQIEAKSLTKLKKIIKKTNNDSLVDGYHI